MPSTAGIPEGSRINPNAAADGNFKSEQAKRSDQAQRAGSGNIGGDNLKFAQGSQGAQYSAGANNINISLDSPNINISNNEKMRQAADNLDSVKFSDDNYKSYNSHYNSESKVNQSIADFSVIMLEYATSARLMRKNERLIRNTRAAGQQKTIDSQADAQKKAAITDLAAGVGESAGKIASAAASGIGATKGLAADKAAVQAGGQAGQGTMISQQWSAGGSAIDAISGLTASSARYQSAQYRAQETEKRGEEAMQRHLRDTAQDQMQMSKELFSEANSKFKEIQSQVIQTNTNIAKNI